MRTSFLSADVNFKARLRDDAKDGGIPGDLVITIRQTCDESFVNTTEIWCISEEDIDGMIAELQICKRDVRKWQAEVDKVNKAQKNLTST